MNPIKESEMLSFLRLVAAIAVSMSAGFAFGAMVGEGNRFGPWPFAVAVAVVGTWVSVR
jgi:hypothetical protein